MSRKVPKDEFHLRFDAVQAEGDVIGAPISFNAVLGSSGTPEMALAGLSGILLDTRDLDDAPACVTVLDALRRHTPPKRLTVVSGPAARSDMEGGTDGRVVTDARFVMFAWLPEIYDAGQAGVGTRLLTQLRSFLMVDDIFVLLDLGVDDEKEGFVSIFYPHLGEIGLELSETGQFAQGRWRPRPAPGRRHEIGVVHL